MLKRVLAVLTALAIDLLHVNHGLVVEAIDDTVCNRLVAEPKEHQSDLEAACDRRGKVDDAPILICFVRFKVFRVW